MSRWRWTDAALSQPRLDLATREGNARQNDDEQRVHRYVEHRIPWNRLRGRKRAFDPHQGTLRRQQDGYRLTEERRGGRQEIDATQRVPHHCEQAEEQCDPCVSSREHTEQRCERGVYQDLRTNQGEYGTAAPLAENQQVERGQEYGAHDEREEGQHERSSAVEQ